VNPALDPRPRPRRSRAERRVTFALKVLALVVLGAYALSKVFAFAGRVHSVTIILVGAVFFSYMLYPLVRRLNERLPLGWSILIAYLLIAVVAVFGIWIVVPALGTDLQTLVRSTPALVQKAQSFLADSNNPIVERMPDWLRTYLEGLVPSSLGFLQHYAAAEAANALAFLLSTFALIATVIVIPVISIYVMFEAVEWRDNLMRALPARAHPRATALLSDLDVALGGFIRGQLIVGAIIGSLITIVLLATRSCPRR
jgi:predicted PurR-regulated permease PerM